MKISKTQLILSFLAPLVCSVIILSGIFLYSSKETSINGTLLQTYETAGEIPWQATFSDGKYYIFDSEPGAYMYDVSVEESFEDKEYVYSIDDGEVVDLKSHNGNAFWSQSIAGRRHSADIMMMTPDGIVRELYTMSGDGEAMQYPYISATDECVYFVERRVEGEKAVLLEYNIQNNSMRIIDSFNEYDTYKPVVCSSGTKVVTVSGISNGSIMLLNYDSSTGSKHHVILPNTTDLIYGLDYDDKTGMYVVYYHDTASNSEKIGTFYENDANFQVIQTLRYKQSLIRDKIQIHNDKILWIEYTPPRFETIGMREFRKMKMYDLSGRMYYRDGVIEFCIDADELYAFEATPSMTRELYHLEWP